MTEERAVATIEAADRAGYARGWADGEQFVMDHLWEYTPWGRAILTVQGWASRTWRRVWGLDSGTRIL